MYICKCIYNIINTPTIYIYGKQHYNGLMNTFCAIVNVAFVNSYSKHTDSGME